MQSVRSAGCCRWSPLPLRTRCLTGATKSSSTSPPPSPLVRDTGRRSAPAPNRPAYHTARHDVYRLVGWPAMSKVDVHKTVNTQRNATPPFTEHLVKTGCVSLVDSPCRYSSGQTDKWTCLPEYSTHLATWWTVMTKHTVDMKDQIQLIRPTTKSTHCYLMSVLSLSTNVP